MKLNITYANSKFKKREKLIEAVIEQSLSSILKTRKTLNIEIGYCKRTGAMAHFEEEGKKRTYYIRFNKSIVKTKTRDDLMHFVMVLCHECVHIKQFVKEELILNDAGDDLIWTVGEHPYELDSYYFTPWEVEANGLELALTLDFFKNTKHKCFTKKQLKSIRMQYIQKDLKDTESVNKIRMLQPLRQGIHRTLGIWRIDARTDPRYCN